VVRKHLADIRFPGLHYLFFGFDDPETGITQKSVQRTLKLCLDPKGHFAFFPNSFLQKVPERRRELGPARMKLFDNGLDVRLVAGLRSIVVLLFRQVDDAQRILDQRAIPLDLVAVGLDGLLLGAGDAMIGINPATDSPGSAHALLCLLDEVRSKLAIPTQSCVLAHVTTTLDLIARGTPVDLVFQSIAGSEGANRSFGINLALLQEAHDAAQSLARGTVGSNVMYFETGQGSALSAGQHHGVDQQTMEARAYAVARHFKPFLVNTVVGFIGPEYLYDGKQITRAALEDQFCGKLLGLPMGCDVCYTNHAEADQDDMDALLALLVASGVNFVMGVPGADDIMLGYQSTSFHDALAMRDLLGKRPAPEFEQWLAAQGLVDGQGRVRPGGVPLPFRQLLGNSTKP